MGEEILVVVEEHEILEDRVLRKLINKTKILCGSEKQRYTLLNFSDQNLEGLNFDSEPEIIDAASLLQAKLLSVEEDMLHFQRLMRGLIQRPSYWISSVF